MLSSSKSTSKALGRTNTFPSKRAIPLFEIERVVGLRNCFCVKVNSMCPICLQTMYTCLHSNQWSVACSGAVAFLTGTARPSFVTTANVPFMAAGDRFPPAAQHGDKNRRPPFRISFPDKLFYRFALFNEPCAGQQACVRVRGLIGCRDYPETHDGFTF
jgi:hypothetical protein